MPATPAPAPAGDRLVYADEFNGNALDLGSWSYQLGEDGGLNSAAALQVFADFSMNLVDTASLSRNLCLAALPSGDGTAWNIPAGWGNGELEVRLTLQPVIAALQLCVAVPVRSCRRCMS